MRPTIVKAQPFASVWASIHTGVQRCLCYKKIALGCPYISKGHKDFNIAHLSFGDFSHLYRCILNFSNLQERARQLSVPFSDDYSLQRSLGNQITVQVQLRSHNLNRPVRYQFVSTCSTSSIRKWYCKAAFYWFYSIFPSNRSIFKFQKWNL